MIILVHVLLSSDPVLICMLRKKKEEKNVYRYVQRTWTRGTRESNGKSSFGRRRRAEIRKKSIDFDENLKAFLFSFEKETRAADGAKGEESAFLFQKTIVKAAQNKR